MRKQCTRPAWAEPVSAGFDVTLVNEPMAIDQKHPPIILPPFAESFTHSVVFAMIEEAPPSIAGNNSSRSPSPCSAAF